MRVLGNPQVISFCLFLALIALGLVWLLAKMPYIRAFCFGLFSLGSFVGSFIAYGYWHQWQTPTGQVALALLGSKKMNIEGAGVVVGLFLGVAFGVVTWITVKDADEGT